MPGSIRVLIVDDSALMRHRLSGAISGAPGFEVAGYARGGEDCLAQLPRLQPDVITLDVEMPGLDGLQTLKRIMQVRPTPVVMVSAMTEAGAQSTLDALSLGAVDYLTKPTAGAPDEAARFAQELTQKLATAATARTMRAPATSPPRTPGTAPVAPRGALPTPATSPRPGASWLAKDSHERRQGALLREPASSRNPTGRQDAGAPGPAQTMPGAPTQSAPDRSRLTVVRPSTPETGKTEISPSPPAPRWHTEMSPPASQAPQAPQRHIATTRRERGTSLVVIGSSTGGPQALDRLFDHLSPRVPAAFLVVQHMPPLFTQSLAGRLARRSGMSVREGAENDPLIVGEVLVAPGGFHMTVGADGRIHLDETPPLHSVRPAVDRTLLSVAEHWTGRCLVVILTGMGSDGAKGARALRLRGSEVLAQDEESSIVYGMPRAVVEAGAASAILPLDEIAPAIEHWVFASAAAPLLTRLTTDY